MTNNLSETVTNQKLFFGIKLKQKKKKQVWKFHKNKKILEIKTRAFNGNASEIKFTKVYDTKCGRNHKKTEIIFFDKIKTQGIETCPKISEKNPKKTKIKQIFF
jgi:hypothetical protein